MSIERQFDFHIKVNGRENVINSDPNKPLLWILREELNLTGAKYGCGIAQCGACTVLLDGKPIRSCITPIKRADGRSLLTIEGLSKNRDHPIQRAWIAEQVPQCGFCQSGQIMSAVALLNIIKNPSDEDINDAMAGNICRCGTYCRIRKAIHLASQFIAESRP